MGRRLQPRGHLARVHRIHAAVIVSGEEQHGWIIRSVFDVVIRRIRVQGLKLVAFLDGSKFGYVEDAVRKSFDTKHVVDSHVTYYRPEQYRTLRKRRAYQKSAVTAAFDDELLGTRVLALDQVLRGCDEIVEDF